MTLSTKDRKGTTAVNATATQDRQPATAARLVNKQERAAYSLASIEAALKNWPTLREFTNNLDVVIVRADISNAIKHLDPHDLETIYPVLQHGQAAFELTGEDGRRLMSYRRWGRVTRRLYQILNVEGAI